MHSVCLLHASFALFVVFPFLSPRIAAHLTNNFQNWLVEKLFKCSMPFLMKSMFSNRVQAFETSTTDYNDVDDDDDNDDG